jgi:hypothetical protein
MESAVRVLLGLADDPMQTVSPIDFDGAAMRSRVDALKASLERIADRPFVLHTTHGASYFADLVIKRSGGNEGKRIDVVFLVRFSNFGDLFTIWGNCRSERLEESVVAELIAEVTRGGFRFVPVSALVEPYSGQHAGFRYSSWLSRFFGTL